jgi:hypothetical protein
MRYLSVLYLAFFSFSICAQTSFNTQTIIGVWKVSNTKGLPLYSVKIEVENDRYFGEIVEVFYTDGDSLIFCSKCSGELRNAPLVGLEVLSDMVKGPVKYSKGSFFNFINGDSSPCTMWMVNDSVVKVRSWWLFLYRTYVWYRIS